MAKLGEVCKLNMGQSPDSSSYNDTGDGIPFFQGNADFGEVHPNIRVWCNAPTKIAHPGEILISVRAPIGAMNIADCECCIGRGLASISADEAVCTTKYLWYGISSKIEELNAKGTGSTFKAVNKKTLEETEIPIRDLMEQERIVAKLDSVTALITLRKRQVKKLDELVKARFVEMFGNKDYPRMKWNNVFNTTTGKLDSNAAVDNGKYPFFTCSKEPLKIDSYAFDQTALLLAGNNAAGKYDVKYYQGKFNAYQRTYVLSLKHNWSYKLFQYQLEDKLLYLQTKSLGGLTKYLTLKILGELDFIVPPLALQNEFATFVARIDQQKQTVQQSLEKLELMRKALMQEYFG